MSLWKNSAGPKDAPTWYARHGVFSGLDISENKITKITGTSFETGDCVVYLSDTPITGLSNKGVYYVRNLGSSYKLFDTRVHANTLTSEDGLKEISVASEAGKHLFVVYERKETTNDGKEKPALIAVSKETAALRAVGLVSPGWYRYFKYTNSENQDRVHLELLAGVKTMVTEGDYSITSAKFTNTNIGDGKWSNLEEAITDRSNKLAFTITTTGPLHKDLYLAFGMWTYNPDNPDQNTRFINHDKAHIRFECNGEEVTEAMPAAWCWHAYSVIPVNVDSAQEILVEVVMYEGTYRQFSKYDRLLCEYALSDSVEGLVAIAEAGFPKCYGDYVDPTPKYELSYEGVHGSNPNELEEGWTNLSDNYLKIVITPNEAFTDNVDLIVTMKDYTNRTNLYDLGFDFVDNETEEPIEWITPNNNLIKTVNFNDSSEPVTLLWKVIDGNIRGLTLDGIETLINAVSTESGSKVASGKFDVYYTLYDLDFKTVSFNEGEEETHKSGWFEEDDVKGSTVSIIPTGTPGTIRVKYKAETAEGASFVENEITFSASHGDGAVALPVEDGYVYQDVTTDGEEIKNIGFYIIGGGVSSDLGRCKLTLVCESTELRDGTVEDHTYIDPVDTSVDGVHGPVTSGWVVNEPNSLKFVFAPDGGVSYEDVKVSIALTDRESGSSLEDLGFKFIDGDEGEMSWEDGKLTKTFSVEETIDPNNPLARLCAMSEGDLNTLGSQVDVTMDVSTPSFGKTTVINTIDITK